MYGYRSGMKVNSRCSIQCCAGFRFFPLLLAVILAILLLNAQYVSSDESASDPACRAINSSYRASRSPLLRISGDKLNWPPVIPPEPLEVGKVKEPTAVEVYDVATGVVTRIACGDVTHQLAKPALRSTPSYQGLFPPDILPESVLPPDDRERITPTTTFPWTSICKLFITFPYASVIGSGAIIGRSDGNAFHVLTAGHCVHYSNYGGWATSIEVVPALDLDYMPFYHAFATQMRAYSGWTQYQMHEHDWAVVTLDRRTGNYTGWMGRMTAPPDDEVYTGTLNIAGYPGDLMGGLGMFWDSDLGRIATEYNHWYYMDTYGGQSGAPVWVHYPSTDERHILTIHAYGNDGSNSNHGTRLDQDKFDQTIAWIDSDPIPDDKADLIDDGQEYSGFAPTLVEVGASFQVWCDVRNIGTESSGSLKVTYYASADTNITSSDHTIANDVVSSITPFTRDDSDWSGDFAQIPSGIYYVGWIIDSMNDVTEFDESNNTACKSSYQLMVDNDPSAPVISSTHTESVWSNSNAPGFDWTEPYDMSGIIGYSYILDQVSNTIPDTVSEGEDRSKYYSGITDGTWYFHVRACDGDGNWGSTGHYGPVLIDVTSPSAPIVSSSTHTEGVPSSDMNPCFDWTEPAYETAGQMTPITARGKVEEMGITITSDPSGITGYSYVFDHLADTVPDEVSEGTDRSECYVDVGDGEWYFHVRACDGAGNWGSTDHYGPVIIEDCIDIPLKAGWNLISVPGDPENPVVSELVKDTPVLPYFYTWDPQLGGYVRVDRIQFCVGYWVATTEDYVLRICYSPVYKVERMIYTGWNMVCSPDCVFPVDSIVSQPPCHLSSVYTWDPVLGGYVIVTELIPGGGYWMAATCDCMLIMDCADVLLVQSTPENETLDLGEPTWKSIVSVENQELAFGMHPSASDGFDRLLDKPLPPPPVTASDDVKNRGGKKLNGIVKAGWVIADTTFPMLSDSYVKESTQGVWELSVELPKPGKIEWSDLPEGYRCILQYGKRSVDMNSKEFLPLPAGEYKLTLVLDALSSLPRKTEVLANYPNPFNPETWIPYRLSEDGHVTLIIRDVSGREVRRFHLGRQLAGEYVGKERAIYWDGRNESGELVSSGVYFYTLQTGRFTQTGKLAIVR